MFNFLIIPKNIFVKMSINLKCNQNYVNVVAYILTIPKIFFVKISRNEKCYQNYVNVSLILTIHKNVKKLKKQLK